MEGKTEKGKKKKTKTTKEGAVVTKDTNDTYQYMVDPIDPVVLSSNSLFCLKELE